MQVGILTWLLPCFWEGLVARQRVDTSFLLNVWSPASYRWQCFNYSSPGVCVCVCVCVCSGRCGKAYLSLSLPACVFFPVLNDWGPFSGALGFGTCCRDTHTQTHTHTHTHTDTHTHIHDPPPSSHTSDVLESELLFRKLIFSSTQSCLQNYSGKEGCVYTPFCFFIYDIQFI